MRFFVWNKSHFQRSTDCEEPNLMICSSMQSLKFQISSFYLARFLANQTFLAEVCWGHKSDSTLDLKNFQVSAEANTLHTPLEPCRSF